MVPPVMRHLRRLRLCAVVAFLGLHLGCRAKVQLSHVAWLGIRGGHPQALHALSVQVHRWLLWQLLALT